LALSVISALVAGDLLLGKEKQGIALIEISFLIPPLIYLILKNYSLKQCMRWNKVPRTWILSSLLIGFSMMILLDEINRIIAVFAPLPLEIHQANLDILLFNNWTDFCLLFAGVVVVAAICEESLFRGFFQTSLEAYSSVTRGVFLSAMIFTLAHFNPWWMVQTFLLGIVLGIISWRTNSTFPAMIVQGLYSLFLIWHYNIDETKWGWLFWNGHLNPVVLLFAVYLLISSFKRFLKQTEVSFAG
jgi:membrane protease YdiL (CAAX protease family)